MLIQSYTHSNNTQRGIGSHSHRTHRHTDTQKHTQKRTQKRARARTHTHTHKAFLRKQIRLALSTLIARMRLSVGGLTQNVCVGLDGLAPKSCLRLFVSKLRCARPLKKPSSCQTRAAAASRVLERAARH